MAGFTHQMSLEHETLEIHITNEKMMPPRHGRRAVNRELVRKMGDLIITGEPTLFIDEAEGVIYWKVPFLVQPPDDDEGIYLTGQYAMVDALSGEYQLKEEAIEAIETAAKPIIHRLYPDMEAYLRGLEEVTL